MNGSPSFPLLLRSISAPEALRTGALETHSAFLRGQPTIVPKYNTSLVTNPAGFRLFDGRSQAPRSSLRPVHAASRTLLHPLSFCAAQTAAQFFVAGGYLTIH